MKPTDQYRRADLAPPARRHGCRPHEPGPAQTRRRSSAGAHCSPPRPERHALARPLLRLLLAAMALTASPWLAAQQGGGAQAPTPVIVTELAGQAFSETVEALGTLRANESVNLTSTVTELVTAVNFDDGQRVKKGDVLIAMDTSEERAELAEQRSFLDEAQRQVDRLAPLVKRGAASESTIDTKRREAQGARARIKAIESRIAKRIIKAPFNGVVGLRNISVGALAQPGAELTTIDDDAVMKLDFAVPSVFVATLKPGLSIEAESAAYPGRVFKGTVSSVNSRIDPVTRSIVARALIDNPKGELRPGLLMRVELQKSPRQALVVPEEAVVPVGNENFVWIVADKDGQAVAERRTVTLGTRQFGGVEVLSGLSPGERVVTHGTLRMRPGAPLTITAVEHGDEPLESLLRQTSAATGAGKGRP